MTDDIRLVGVRPMGGWAVARRLDWPGAKRPFFLFNGTSVWLYNRPSKGPVWFKTQESAQRCADDLNARPRAAVA